ncbi:MAG: hypothetical protein Q8P67_15230 [archaeon]|nr:hypothetical protein [archaeon]
MILGAAASWSPCPAITPDTTPALPLSLLLAFNATPAECLTLSVPLNYGDDDPASPTMPLFVKHFPSVDRAADRRVFIIPGGPGESGADVKNVAAFFLSVFPPNSIEVYLVDHRGTGRSSNLACLSDPSAGICPDDLSARYGQDLMYYTTEFAARDYQTVINLVKTELPHQETLLYSGSYGTYLHNRILTLDDTIADANILDSPATYPFVFIERDQAADITGKCFLSRCRSDPDCLGVC